MTSAKDDLLTIYRAGLDAVVGEKVVSRELKKNNYPELFHVVSIGKASDAMLEGVPKDRVLSALLISKHDHISEKSKLTSKIQCIESDHPVPKKPSINAGFSLLEFLKKLPKTEPCLFLISGGASALVEVLEDDWSLEELSELTDYLLANAYPIDEINAVRKRISKIKGGGLWSYIGDREVRCLIISDVPNDDPADIGSGLLFKSNLLTLPELPPKWADKIKPMQEVIIPDTFKWKILGSLEIAKNASATKAEDLGYKVIVVTEFLEGSAEQVAHNCVNTIMNQRKTLFIWGGETTVLLPKNPGKGGRNQHLALASAILMSGEQGLTLLSAGTDGTDGLTDATGAIVDDQTISKGKSLGLDASDYLQRADSNQYFQQTEELVVTGATGTNVMDLVIGVSD